MCPVGRLPWLWPSAPVDQQLGRTETSLPSLLCYACAVAEHAQHAQQSGHIDSILPSLGTPLAVLRVSMYLRAGQGWGVHATASAHAQQAAEAGRPCHTPPSMCLLATSTPPGSTPRTCRGARCCSREDRRNRGWQGSVSCQACPRRLSATGRAHLRHAVVGWVPVRCGQQLTGAAALTLAQHTCGWAPPPFPFSFQVLYIPPIHPAFLSSPPRFRPLPRTKLGGVGVRAGAQQQRLGDGVRRGVGEREVGAGARAVWAAGDGWSGTKGHVWRAAGGGGGREGLPGQTGGGPRGAMQRGKLRGTCGGVERGAASGLLGRGRRSGRHRNGGAGAALT